MSENRLIGSRQSASTVTSVALLSRLAELVTKLAYAKLLKSLDATPALQSDDPAQAMKGRPDRRRITAISSAGSISRRPAPLVPCFSSADSAVPSARGN